MGKFGLASLVWFGLGWIGLEFHIAVREFGIIVLSLILAAVWRLRADRSGFEYITMAAGARRTCVLTVAPSRRAAGAA